MTSIVIPYKFSQSSTLELRYCLRSIRKYLKGYGDIFVIGDDPKLSEVIHISATDEPAYSQKERNVFNKLLLACADQRVSETFLYMNDDHYLLSPVHIDHFPAYYSTSWESGQGLYMNTVSNTKARYECKRNFDLHCPILMSKAGLQKLANLPWQTKFGYCIKTAYCEENGIEGEYCADLKIKEPTLTAEQITRQIASRKWFSTGDYVFREGGMKEVMDSLYESKAVVNG